MDTLSATLRIVLEVVLLWTLLSIVVAFPVTALFRAQARREELTRAARRRAVWLDETSREDTPADHRGRDAARDLGRAGALSRPA
jgi:hypothetical protein